MSKKTIAIDLDGTLASYSGWKGLEHIGDPLPGAQELIGRLIDEGFDVVLYTTRTNPDVNGGTAEELAKLVQAWLDRNGFDSRFRIALGGKPIAMMYIDDRAFEVPTNVAWGKKSYQQIARLAREDLDWSTRVMWTEDFVNED